MSITSMEPILSHLDPIQTAAPPARFVSIKEFACRSSLARSSIYRMIERGEISKPCKLAPKRIGWPAEVVNAWFAARMTQAALTPAPSENCGLTPAELTMARASVMPFISALRGQPGGEVIATLSDGTQIVAARVRKLRRRLWPSQEYEALSNAVYSAENEDARRACRARLYPEPVRGGK